MVPKESTVFEEIISPVITLMEEEALGIEGDLEKYKLSFFPFAFNLLFGIINGIKSVSLLITHLKTLPKANELGFINASNSMYSEAFIRYEPKIFRRIFYKLLEKLNFLNVPEIAALGRFILIDGSIFPAIQTMFWAAYKKSKNAIKMHLAFELNRMIPVEFINSDANKSERNMLLKMVEAGVTFIGDRGYASFNVFKEILLMGGHFIIRGKSNLVYTIKENLSIEIPEHWQSLISEVKDLKVQFKSDKHLQDYRVVCFTALGESFLLITDRFDLKTYEVIMLYAYRWQVELIFRFFKRTLNALHLMCHEPRGIEIQFTLYMIAYLLLLSFKQECHLKENNIEETSNSNLEEKNIDEFQDINNTNDDKTSSYNKQGASKEYRCGLVSLLGKKLQKYWKIGIHWLKGIRNLLFEPFTPEIVKTICLLQ